MGKKITEEDIFKQPRLFPQVEYIVGKDLKELQKKVNKWLSETEAEVKNIVTRSGDVYFTEVLYVKYPKPTPRPVEKKDGKRADKVQKDI